MERLLQPFKAVWHRSWTKGLGYTQMAIGGAVEGVVQLSNTLNNDTVKSYLNDMGLPQGIFIGIAVLGLITFLAHGRD